MEEIDNIIIDSLRNLHCEIEDDITSLKQFDANLVITSISLCLEAIIPNSNFPKCLPPSMSLKLKITSNLAEQIKELGFRDDIGYQTILYCNEAEIRRVFMFLIERLPREAGKISHVEQTGYVPTLVKEIEKKVKHSLEQFWVPTSILNNGYRKTEKSLLFHSLGDSSALQTKKLEIPCSAKSYNNEALKQYWIHNAPEVTRQCELKELIPSLLFHEDFKIPCNSIKLQDFQNMPIKNEKELSSQILNSSVSIDETKIPPSVDEVKTEAENKLETLVASVKNQKTKFLALQEAIKECDLQLKQFESMKGKEEEILKNSLSKISLKTKTLTVIRKEENLLKLKNLIETNNNKLINLADQWNEVQAPLLEEYKSLQNTISSEDLKYQEERNKLRKIQETFQTLKTDLTEKIQLEDQLKKRLEQLNKNYNRSSYTRRILEIIGNIKKQDNEIDKILIDTRTVQREISSLTGQVDRSFTLSDELIFRDARQDDTARKAYKLLAQLRDECSDIIKAVTDLGAVERECRNLQEQIEFESAKENAVKYERVNKDLQDMKKETEMLLKT